MSSRARHLKKAAVPMRVRASLVSCLVAGLIAGGLREGVAHAASGDSDRQRDRAQIVDWMAAAYGVSWEYSLAVLEAARKLDPQQYTVRRGAPTQHRAIESAGLVSTEASNGRLVVSHIDSALRWEMFTDRRRGRAKGNRHRINDTVYTAGVRRGRGGGEWIKIKRQGPLLRVRHELTPLSFHAGPGRPDEIVTMSHEFELGRGNNPVDGPYLRPQVRGILLQGQFGGEQSPVAPIIRSTASFGDGIGNMLDWMPWASFSKNLGTPIRRSGPTARIAAGSRSGCSTK